MGDLFPTKKQKATHFPHQRSMRKIVGILPSFLPQAWRRRSLRRYVDHCVGLDGWNYPTLVRWALGAWFLGWMCFDIFAWKPWKSRVGSDVDSPLIHRPCFGEHVNFRACIDMFGVLKRWVDNIHRKLSKTVGRGKFWWSNMPLQRDHCICSMLLVKSYRI